MNRLMHKFFSLNLPNLCLCCLLVICLLQFFQENSSVEKNSLHSKQEFEGESKSFSGADSTSRSLLSPDFINHDAESLNKWMRELEQDDRFLSRRQHVMKLCKQKRKKNLHKILSDRIKYIDKANLIMCDVPKTASTSWKTLFLQLDGYKGAINDTVLKHWAFNKFPINHFGKLRLKDAMHRDKQYTSFLVSRHPLTRLVSTYYDKFSNFSKYEMLKQLHGRRIAYMHTRNWIHKFENALQFNPRISNIEVALNTLVESRNFKHLPFKEKKKTAKYLYAMRTGEISFSQFIDYIISQYNGKKFVGTDPHWQIQVDICMPCLLNYSFFVKFESLAAESERLLHYFQRKQNLNSQHLHFPNKTFENFEITDQIIRDAWKLIPEEKVQIIRNIYTADFLFYNYDPFLYRGHNRASELHYADTS